MGDGALTGQWVAVTHCNELGEDKKKKEEQHGILGDVIDPAMQWRFRPHLLPGFSPSMSSLSFSMDTTLVAPGTSFLNEKVAPS